MTAPLLETDNVTYTYPNGPAALAGVSVRIAAGSKTALVGPNGAGKSTLLLMLNGMLRPASGEVRFDGRPLAYDNRSLRDLRRRVGFVFQNPDVQIIAPTVEQDVAFGPVNLGLSPDAVRRAVRDALGYVGLRGYEKRPPHHLSGGEKKRVAIAGILAMEPAVLVFDEPTNTLDPASSEEVMELLDELASGGRTVLISTHDVELAYRWADSVILMERGASSPGGRRKRSSRTTASSPPPASNRPPSSTSTTSLVSGASSTAASPQKACSSSPTGSSGRCTATPRPGTSPGRSTSATPTGPAAKSCGCSLSRGWSSTSGRWAPAPRSSPTGSGSSSTTPTASSTSAS
jgi:cobalt transport protein ATP-binding subunit